jgi:hypothetical protein
VFNDDINIDPIKYIKDDIDTLASGKKSSEVFIMMDFEMKLRYDNEVSKNSINEVKKMLDQYRSFEKMLSNSNIGSKNTFDKIFTVKGLVDICASMVVDIITYIYGSILSNQSRSASINKPVKFETDYAMLFKYIASCICTGADAITVINYVDTAYTPVAAGAGAVVIAAPAPGYTGPLTGKFVARADNRTITPAGIPSMPHLPLRNATTDDQFTLRRNNIIEHRRIVLADFNTWYSTQPTTDAEWNARLDKITMCVKQFIGYIVDNGKSSNDPYIKNFTFTSAVANDILQLAEGLENVETFIVSCLKTRREYYSEINIPFNTINSPGAMYGIYNNPQYTHDSKVSFCRAKINKLEEQLHVLQKESESKYLPFTNTKIDNCTFYKIPSNHLANLIYMDGFIVMMGQHIKKYINYPIVDLQKVGYTAHEILKYNTMRSLDKLSYEQDRTLEFDRMFLTATGSKQVEDAIAIAYKNGDTEYKRLLSLLANPSNPNSLEYRSVVEILERLRNNYVNIVKSYIDQNKPLNVIQPTNQFLNNVSVGFAAATLIVNAATVAAGFNVIPAFNGVDPALVTKITASFGLLRPYTSAPAAATVTINAIKAASEYYMLMPEAPAPIVQTFVDPNVAAIAAAAGGSIIPNPHPRYSLASGSVYAITKTDITAQGVVTYLSSNSIKENIVKLKAHLHVFDGIMKQSTTARNSNRDFQRNSLGPNFSHLLRAGIDISDLFIKRGYKWSDVISAMSGYYWSRRVSGTGGLAPSYSIRSRIDLRTVEYIRGAAPNAVANTVPAADGYIFADTGGSFVAINAAHPTNVEDTANIFGFANAIGTDITLLQQLSIMDPYFRNFHIYMAAICGENRHGNGGAPLASLTAVTAAQGVLDGTAALTTAYSVLINRALVDMVLTKYHNYTTNYIDATCVLSQDLIEYIRIFNSNPVEDAILGLQNTAANNTFIRPTVNNISALMAQFQEYGYSPEQVLDSLKNVKNPEDLDLTNDIHRYILCFNATQIDTATGANDVIPKGSYIITETPVLAVTPQTPTASNVVEYVEDNKKYIDPKCIDKNPVSMDTYWYKADINFYNENLTLSQYPHISYNNVNNQNTIDNAMKACLSTGPLARLVSLIKKFENLTCVEMRRFYDLINPKFDNTAVSEDFEIVNTDADIPTPAAGNVFVKANNSTYGITDYATWVEFQLCIDKFYSNGNIKRINSLVNNTFKTQLIAASGIAGTERSNDILKNIDKEIFGIADSTKNLYKVRVDSVHNLRSHKQKYAKHVGNNKTDYTDEYTIIDALYFVMPYASFDPNAYDGFDYVPINIIGGAGNLAINKTRKKLAPKQGKYNQIYKKSTHEHVYQNFLLLVREYIHECIDEIISNKTEEGVAILRYLLSFTSSKTSKLNNIASPVLYHPTNVNSAAGVVAGTDQTVNIMMVKGYPNGTVANSDIYEEFFRDIAEVNPHWLPSTVTCLPTAANVNRADGTLQLNAGDIKTAMIAKFNTANDGIAARLVAGGGQNDSCPVPYQLNPEYIEWSYLNIPNVLQDRADAISSKHGADLVNTCFSMSGFTLIEDNPFVLIMSKDYYKKVIDFCNGVEFNGTYSTIMELVKEDLVNITSTSPTIKLDTKPLQSYGVVKDYSKLCQKEYTYDQIVESSSKILTKPEPMNNPHLGSYIITYKNSEATKNYKRETIKSTNSDHFRSIDYTLCYNNASFQKNILHTPSTDKDKPETIRRTIDYYPDSQAGVVHNINNLIYKMSGTFQNGDTVYSEYMNLINSCNVGRPIDDIDYSTYIEIGLPSAMASGVLYKSTLSITTSLSKAKRITTISELDAGIKQSIQDECFGYKSDILYLIKTAEMCNKMKQADSNIVLSLNIPVKQYTIAGIKGGVRKELNDINFMFVNQTYPLNDFTFYYTKVMNVLGVMKTFVENCINLFSMKIPMDNYFLKIIHGSSVTEKVNNICYCCKTNSLMQGAFNSPNRLFSETAIQANLDPNITFEKCVKLLGTFNSSYSDKYMIDVITLGYKLRELFNLTQMNSGIVEMWNKNISGIKQFNDEPNYINIFLKLFLIPINMSKLGKFAPFVNIILNSANMLELIKQELYNQSYNTTLAEYQIVFPESNSNGYSFIDFVSADVAIQKIKQIIEEAEKNKYRTLSNKPVTLL